MGDDQKQPVVRWHAVGSAQSADREVFAVRDHPTRVPYGTVTEDGRYLVITLDEGTFTNGIVVMSLDKRAAVEPVFVDYDGDYSYLGSRKGQGTELLFRTTAGAANSRVIAVDMGKPPAQRARVVVPESTHAMDMAALVGDRVIAAYLKDAHAEVQLFDAGSAKPVGAVKLPGLGAVAGFTGEPGDTESFFSFEGFSTPRRVYRLDMASGEATLLREPKFAADTADYVTEQVFFKSKDGTRVPMFIVHRRDLKRDARQLRAAGRLRRIRRRLHAVVFTRDGHVAGDGRRLRRGQPARRRRVRRRVAQGRDARAQAERVR